MAVAIEHQLISYMQPRAKRLMLRCPQLVRHSPMASHAPFRLGDYESGGRFGRVSRFAPAVSPVDTSGSVLQHATACVLMSALVRPPTRLLLCRVMSLAMKMPDPGRPGGKNCWQCSLFHPADCLGGTMAVDEDWPL